MEAEVVCLMPMNKIDAAIFDMDGLILDSEPFWHEAEVRVFRTVGLELTREDCLEFIGVPIGEVVAQRFRLRPWSNRTQREVTDDIIAGVEEQVRMRGEPLPGVRETLDFVRRKGIRLGLASSSAMRLIEAVTAKLGLTRMFDLLLSAESERRGKPHPDIFLSTARGLGVEPEACVVFEDSVNGFLASRAAGMRTVVVPAPEQFDDGRLSGAGLKLRTLGGFGEQEWNQLLLLQPPSTR